MAGEFADWGDMHRLRLAHPLALVPLIGERYRFDETPVGGSTDSLMKTAHGSTVERHFVRYGSDARHISDLSLLFIPSALATEGFCKSLPYAYALFALTDIGRESKDFCGGRN